MRTHYERSWILSTTSTPVFRSLAAIWIRVPPILPHSTTTPVDIPAPSVPLTPPLAPAPPVIQPSHSPDPFIPTPFSPEASLQPGALSAETAAGNSAHHHAALTSVGGRTQPTSRGAVPPLPHY
ncbi:hypothetical protein ABVT39_010645 [Epinephelus coioides]